MRLASSSLVLGLALGMIATTTRADDGAFNPEPKPFTIVHTCWTRDEVGYGTGSYEARLTIDANGATTAAHVGGIDAVHAACVEKLVSQWRYPLGHAGDVRIQVRWDGGHATAGAVR